MKPTNPKDAVGIRKVPLSTVPARVLLELGLGMLEGALKYGRHNYRVSGVRASVYYDAAQRHLTDWWEGQDIDPVSGLPHIVKAMTCLVVVRDAQIQGKLMDDRPPGVGIDMAELNALASALMDKYPNPKAAFTRRKTGHHASSKPSAHALHEAQKHARPAARARRRRGHGAKRVG